MLGEGNGEAVTIGEGKGEGVASDVVVDSGVSVAPRRSDMLKSNVGVALLLREAMSGGEAVARATVELSRLLGVAVSLGA